jgi:hypothetical protein
MTKISPAERSRAAKLANMLASDFDGERANAGALLARMAAGHRMTVAELLGLAQAQVASEPPSAAQPSSSRLWDESVELLDRLAAASNFTGVLSEWEAAFASDVSRRYARASQLTEKQRAVAERIVVRAKRAALAGAESTWDDVA